MDINSTQTIDCQGEGFEALLGKVVQERFKVIKPLSNGSYGSVLEVRDLQDTSKHHVIKIQKSEKMIYDEIQAIVITNDVIK